MDFFMKCTDVAFSVVPRKGDGDAENWNRVWVRYGLLFWHSFGIVCCFFHSGFTFNTLHDLLKVIVLYTSCLSVRLSVRSQFMNVGSWLYNRLGKIPERFISSRPCGMNKNNDSLFCTVELSLLGKILFIRHNFWTLRNMVTKLHRYMYLIMTMCCDQDGQLMTSWFINHLPLTKIVPWP